MKKFPICKSFIAASISLCCAASFSASEAMGHPRADERAAVAQDQTAEDHNLAALLSAQAHAQEIITASKNNYSFELTALATRLNAYARRNGTSVNTIIFFLDPIKADVAIGLGLPKPMIVNLLLLQDHVRPLPQIVLPIVAALFSPFPVPRQGHGDGDSYTQKPQALFTVNSDGTRGACIIVPSPNNSVPDRLRISGMSLRNQADFQNLHEGWHCLDNRYYHKFYEPYVHDGFDPGNLQTYIGVPQALEAYANFHKAEVFADVAALGELIRAGSPSSIIDAVKVWRENKAEGLMHQSAPVLGQMEIELQKLGVEKFRALSESAARAFYYQLTETYALNSETLEAKLKDDARHASDAAGTTYKLNDKKVDMYAMYNTSSVQSAASELTSLFTSVFGGTGSTYIEIEENIALQRKLASWDAIKTVYDRACVSRSHLSFASFGQAYVSLMDEYVAKQSSDPSHARLYKAKSELLKQQYTSLAPEFDFYRYNCNDTPRKSPRASRPRHQAIS